MLARTGWDEAGRVGFDPAARRRVRRTAARARPWLLPLAVVLAASVLVSAQAPAPSPVPAPAAPAVPGGMVLVVVQPSDPAVLPLAVPGSRVDVYAAGAPSVLDPLGDGGPVSAERVVLAALVVPPASASLPAGGVGPAGPLAPAGDIGAAGTSGGVTLLVSHDEAAALAARPGGALLVAVRGTAATGTPEATGTPAPSPDPDSARAP